MREQSVTSRLRRVGFSDPARAERLLGDPALAGLPGFDVDALRAVADPDQCLLALIRLAEAVEEPDVLRRVLGGAGADRLLAVLGASSALGDFVITHPGILARFEQEHPLARVTLKGEHEGALRALGAEGVGGARPVASIVGAEGTNALRAWYYTRLIDIAMMDLTHPHPEEIFPEVAAAISHVVGGALEGALAIARAELENPDLDLAIMAMGKTGACEVNYVSDVDVIYVAEGPGDEAEMIAQASKVAGRLARIVSAPSEEPALWILDAALRPEGKDGPLVRTLASHVAYYKRWAKGWEFQALLKARPIAGDLALGERYIEALWPMVWQAAGRDGFVEDSRAMRRRVEQHVPAREADRQLKLGKGGLRDVEFTVQLLQLVHGRADETLRVRPTLEALGRLRAGGYVARADADALDRDYRRLRLMEHRIQLRRLRRSHLVPTGEAELRHLARGMRIDGVTTAEDVEELWAGLRREVRELHQEIYYRPLLPEAARLSPDDISLDEHAAKERLAAIGYRDPAGALRHIVALTDGVSRGAAIQRQLLPVMLGWFAQGPEPDAGLLSFRLLSEEMGRTSWYLRTLRDGGAAAERLCVVLSTSRYVARAMPNLNESVSWLASDSELTPRSREEMDRELDSMLARRDDPTDIARVGRYLRRRELLRTAIGQVLHVTSPEVSRVAVSHAADIAVEAGLRAATRAVCRERGLDEPPSTYLVVAMGRMGGEEMGYASDADVIFVHEPRPDADPVVAAEVANAIASELKRLLGAMDAEPPLPLDYDLRPEGRNGPMARSLDSYREYLQRWAQTWEIQALLRARPCAGDPGLATAFQDLIDPVRYPAEGIDAARITEIRRMKARVETERIPRGVPPQRHLKLGRGGLSDVEWTAQLLALEYAGEHPGLRTLSTSGVLRAAADAGIIGNDDAHRLIEAWETASLMRDLNVLATAKTSGSKVDVLSQDTDELAIIAALVGHEGDPHEVAEAYLRASRRARTDVERIFFGRH